MSDANFNSVVKKPTVDLSVAPPLALTGDQTLSTGEISIPQATASVSGYLSSTDWSAFNTKESALTFSTGLTRATNTVTNNLSTGVSGGQTAIGSTSTNSGLTIKATTGNGTTGSEINFLTGNNGAAAPCRMYSTGRVAMGRNGLTDVADLHIAGINSTSGSNSFGTLFVESANYNGALGSFTGRFDNNDTGTGSSPFWGANTPTGNFGGLFTAQGTAGGSGINIGVAGRAQGSGNTNIGVFGDGTSNAVTTHRYYGVCGFARIPSSGTGVAGYFALEGGVPVFNDSAALIANNAGTTAPILILKDNGTTVAQMIDGGNMGFGATNPGNKVEINTGVTNTSGLRLRQVTTSTPPASATGAFLDVDSNGDVVRVGQSVVLGIAAAGTTQGAATALTGNYSLQEVTSSTAGVSDSVKLPVATTTSRITVVNATNNPIRVFPATSGFINDLLINRAFLIDSKSSMTFMGRSSTQWYTTTQIGTTSGSGDVYCTSDATNSNNYVFLKNIIAGSTAGSSTSVPVITYDDKGRLTAVTDTPINFPSSSNELLYLSTQFDTSSNTLAPISGLDTLSLDGSSFYKFEACLETDFSSSDGFQVSMNGSMGVTEIIYHAELIDNDGMPSAFHTASARQVSLGGTALYDSGLIGSGMIRISGSVKTDKNITFWPEFAQSNPGSLASILVGSTFQVWEVP